ncbi:KdsC family phosphatase [Marivirga harenae]|uniref:KdsC family phosphatase n=1 Tax=Marivirga harenae TaxID=2010992 RepID=UPI0026E11397|nr:HAD-IIIA family hydrolase [Marivirga harenae]WKV12091.1 HAD-IIIA family hydrolase [Marivirga harenae]
MDLLKRNIEAYLAREKKSMADFLDGFNIQRLDQLSLGDFKLFCAESELDYANMLCRPMFVDKSKIEDIKLLILDVDGVMTDAGMFFTENGDQFKKYNAKDGMAIKALEKFGIQTGIISSAHKIKMVKVRAEMLNIKNLYVGSEPKIDILLDWCEKLDIKLSEVAIIGDDINDLAVMKAVGFSACPADAVLRVKETVDLVLDTKGGKGCVREFIDFYLLDEPVG